MWARRKARRALVQAAYQWQLSGNSIGSVKKDFADGDALKKADRVFFDELLSLLASHTSQLDTQFEGKLDREIDKLDPVERSILRLATAEFAWAFGGGHSAR